MHPQRKILVVEDDEVLASVVEAMLVFDGYEVQSAKDGNEGYRTYILFQPDLILTDIQMPRKNGLELMKEIRAHNPKVRAIYMSGNPGRFRGLLEEEAEKYRVDVLQKPFSAAELRELLAGMLLD
jgi:CheY-like chemotaxis protein